MLDVKSNIRMTVWLCSVLKCETVLCTLDATPNVPGHAGLTRQEHRGSRTTSSEHLLPSCSRQEGLFPCFVWKGFPTFPVHLRMRPVSRGNSRRATCISKQILYHSIIVVTGFKSSFAIHTWVFSPPGIQICIWCCCFRPCVRSHVSLQPLLSNLVFPHHIQPGRWPLILQG